MSAFVNDTSRLTSSTDSTVSIIPKSMLPDSKGCHPQRTWNRRARKSAQSDSPGQNPQLSPGTVSPGALLSSNLALNLSRLTAGRRSFRSDTRSGLAPTVGIPGLHPGRSRSNRNPASPTLPKPNPGKPNPLKLEPSKPKPRKPKPPRFNAKPNKSGTSEKSSPPNEDPRLKEVPPQSNGCSPPNRELPNRAAFGPVREWECEEWPNAELPNREFPEFDSPRFASSQDEAISFGVLPREDSPWPDQLREADTALGGRFGLKEDGDLGVLAPED